MSKRRTAAAVLAALGLTAGSVGLAASPAAAALPRLPDNLVVFPDRDFVTVEGFEDRAPGTTATLRVFHGETQTGEASGVFEPSGGVAFEVNHPGGWCWGQNAGPAFQVTPDIVGTDRVEIELSDTGEKFDVPVADIAVLSESRTNNVVTTVSKVPADVTNDRIEARIIAPDLKDTPVGRRDARATFDGTGDTGYTSSLARDADGNIVATYTFDSAATAQTALEGTARIMSWAFTAANGDRLGITISEHEEVGGPGMGGCPAGPGDVAQPGPGGATFLRSADGTSMVVDWVPADAVAGAAAVTGYQVTVTDTDGVMIGRKVAGGATRATLTGLTPSADYTVEVRAATGDALSKPFVATAAGVAPDPATRDTEAPVLAAPEQGADGSVTLSSNDPTAQIYYTLGDVPVTTGDAPTAEAVLYRGPIPVTQPDTVINYAAFDPASNFDTGSGTFQPAAPTELPRLAAPTLNSAVAGPGSVALAWTQVTDATSYQVAVSPAPAAGQPAPVTARVQTVTGLEAGTTYSFTVTALADGRATSASSNALTAEPAVVRSTPQITRAQWKQGDFRIEGITNLTSGTMELRASDAAGARLALLGTAQVTPAVAPETGGDFVLRLRNAAAGTNPGWVVAVAQDGGASAPFRVTTR